MSLDNLVFIGDDLYYVDENGVAIHYGTPRHSGRYPWGSGEDPYQHEGWLLAYEKDCKADGMTEKEIAASLGISQNELRQRHLTASSNEKAKVTAQMVKLREKGYSYRKIAEITGESPTTVQSRLNSKTMYKKELNDNTTNVLRECVEEHNFVDVGRGVDAMMGVSSTRLAAAVRTLQDEGYEVKNMYVKQQSTGKNTTVKVLYKGGDEAWQQLMADKSLVTIPSDYHTTDKGKTWSKMEKPVSLDSSRLCVRYGDTDVNSLGQKDQVGTLMDGVIELRRGVEDISLGGSDYAQVRILVDGDKYLKGMAIYADDLPEGVDVRFNSNKPSAKGPKGALKSIKTTKWAEDSNNPFGANIKVQDGQITGQRHYIDPENGEEKLSIINKVNEEGDWNEWSKTLASQFVSKQSPEFARQQLNLKLEQTDQEFEEIKNLTNPAVKKALMDDFASNCDTNAWKLRAAAVPGQAAKVLLPNTTLKENEIYAPNLNNGDHVALVRYPHAGQFEIPELIVNNNNKLAKATLGNAPDAVMINPAAAAVLSGADFDGDTAIVIPNNNGQIKSKKPFESLKNFDAAKYELDDDEWYEDANGKFHGDKQMEKSEIGKNMGVITNLITDMQVQGCSDTELERAVKHSMVVIDAYKHHYDYKQSEIDQDIEGLKRKYQKNPDKASGYGGAVTLLSRSTSDARNVPEFSKESIDPETGKIIREYTGRTYPTGAAVDKVKKKYKALADEASSSEERTEIYKQRDAEIQELVDSGKAKLTPATQKGRKYSQGYLAEDAYSLVSAGGGTEMEHAFADFSNSMKAKANEARKESLAIKKNEVNKEAAKKYSEEVASLNQKLMTAKKNAPLEAKAQAMAQKAVDYEMKCDPSLKDDNDELKKVKNRALMNARAEVGASKEQIVISDKEWEAIQNNAISYTRQTEIFNNCDKDRLRQLATPRDTVQLSESKKSQIASLYKSGNMTTAEIAQRYGISTSTVYDIANGG